MTLQIKEIDTLLMELSTRFVAVVSEPDANAVLVLDDELEAELANATVAIEQESVEQLAEQVAESTAEAITETTVIDIDQANA